MYTSVSIFDNPQNVLTIPLFFITLSLSLHVSILHSRKYLIIIIFIKDILHVEDTCKINLLLHFFVYVRVFSCFTLVAYILLLMHSSFLSFNWCLQVRSCVNQCTGFCNSHLNYGDLHLSKVSHYFYICGETRTCNCLDYIRIRLCELNIRIRPFLISNYPFNHAKYLLLIFQRLGFNPKRVTRFSISQSPSLNESSLTHVSTCLRFYLTFFTLFIFSSRLFAHVNKRHFVYVEL